MIARVQPLTTTRALRGPFDYRLVNGQADEVAVGALLRIPFARRSTLGVVVGLAERSELPDGRLAEPEAIVGPGLPGDLVALAEWMADEYCSTPARALSLMLPPGATTRSGATKARQALVAQLTEAGRAAVNDPSARLTERQRQLLDALAQRGATVAAELDTAGLRRLEGRGLVSLGLQAQRRRPALHAIGAAAADAPPLTAQQQAALDALLAALTEREPSGRLLQGVTGSGKTEVYLGAVQATLAAGRSAIVLVPEIALTPQVLGRFAARFGDVVAVLHSGLSRGERHDEWMRLRSGEARVCVGPRSAVFAPLADVGLIVVDEEHESSYKHEGDPRYDARWVAARRAQQHGALLVAGSATPRPESVLAMHRLRLTERVDRRPLPDVEVLDMRGHPGPLHPDARMALADLRHRGGKAVMLLNRRGWSNFLSCRACGRVWLCPNCEVALVLHRHEALVACHHCGHREGVPGRCPDCASVSVARHGAGTERIEHELREALESDRAQPFPIFRLDADSSSLSQRARTLQAFGEAPAGVLVGTQMIAKGHDFPDVSLGVVVDADQTLRFPDFRAEERTFALITQLAGRTGRGGGEAASGDGASGARRGRVLVQTLEPDARPIRFATEHDSEGFIADELTRRRALRYPPYASLVRVIASASDPALAVATARQIADRLGPVDGSVLGPAPLFRLRGRSRSQLVVKAAARRPVIAAIGAAVDAVAPAAARRGAAVSVDVDPQ